MTEEEKDTLKRLRKYNVCVDRMLSQGVALADILEALVIENERLTKELVKAEQITPKKRRDGGRTLVWRCPVEHIPMCE